jgi:DNA-binding CsgD family transcriptional regulator
MTCIQKSYREGEGAARVREPRSLSSARSSADGALTALERDVLTTCAIGHLTHEVSDILGLSPEAVHELVRSAMKKLGARSKLEAVVVACRRGEITPPGD